MKARVMLATVLVACLAAFFAPGTRAAVGEPATITAVGWWTLATGVPRGAGGFQVAQDPTGGDMSIGAVKIKLSAAKLSSALFVLNEASSSNRADGAGMFACLTTSDWTPADPGLWTDLPKRDCSKQVQMVRSATQQAWSANLLPLLSGKTGVVSVMFLPGAPPPGSIQVPSLSNLPISLPSLPVPVVGGVPLPPPAVAALLPDLPTSVAFPAQTGYMIDISSAQLGAIPDTGLGALSPLNDTSGGLTSGFDGAGSVVEAPLSSAPPLASSTAPQPAVVEQPLIAAPASTHVDKHWSRLFGLFPLAVLIGAAGTTIRRLTANW